MLHQEESVQIGHNLLAACQHDASSEDCLDVFDL